MGNLFSPLRDDGRVILVVPAIPAGYSFASAVSARPRRRRAPKPKSGPPAARTAIVWRTYEQMMGQYARISYWWIFPRAVRDRLVPRAA